MYKYSRRYSGAQFCTIFSSVRIEFGQTVVTRSISTYRTELSLCQQITSFSSNTAVSMELSDFRRVCSTDAPRNFLLIFLQKVYLLKKLFIELILIFILVGKCSKYAEGYQKHKAKCGQDLGWQFHQSRTLQKGFIIAGGTVIDAVTPIAGIYAGCQLRTCKLAVIWQKIISFQ